ncbi:hypothetical protein [Caldisericum sp.]|uniref:hypothetical protein n=1 Tax=Caldisericum sp. TaxID=2499687 RepID=UPI003D0C6F4D
MQQNRLKEFNIQDYDYTDLSRKIAVINNLSKFDILTTVTYNKRGLKGWNKVHSKSKYLARTIELLKKNNKYDLAINLKASNLVSLDIDNLEKFKQFYKSNFLTLACKTPRGLHYYFINDIGLTGNHTFEQFGFEVHTNHLSNVYGAGYELFICEPQKASESVEFFDTIKELLSLKDVQTSNKYVSISIHKPLKEVDNTSIHKPLKDSHETSKIFNKFREFEKNKEFIQFAFEIVFGVKSKKSMLCVLHDEKNPSASVFRSNVSGRFLYNDFHTNKTYSLLDLLIEYFVVPEHLQKLLELCFARYLLQIFSYKEEIKELYKLLRDRNNNLAKTYFIVASLNTNGLDTHFVGVRDMARMLKLKNITYANRLLNYLCLLDVIDKRSSGRTYKKAYTYNVKEINFRNLLSEIEKTRNIDIYKLSKTVAMKYFPQKKVNKIYMRKSSAGIKV